MTLQVLEAGGGCLCDELRIEICITGDERDIHEGTILRCDGAAEHRRLVEVIIQNLRLLLVPLLHHAEAAHLLQPLEHETAYIDVVAWRRVVEGLRIGMGLVTEHSRGARKHVLTDEVVTDHDDGHAGRADVLLHTAPEDTVLRNIHRLAQEHGGDVGYEILALRVRKLTDRGAVNRVVLTDVYIICVIVDVEILKIRDIAEGLVGRACDHVHLSIHLRFLRGLLRPLACHDVIGHTMAHQVHRHHRKLGVSSTLKEQYLIVFRYAEQLSEIRLGCIDDRLKVLRAMRHLHHGHPASMIIQHLRCCCPKNLLR